MTPNKVLTVGDLHANTRATERLCLEAARTGHRTIYQLGDLGAYWSGLHHLDRFTEVLLKFLARYDLHMTFIDGNHDNHVALRGLPLDNGFGIVSDRLRYAPRGSRWTEGGVRFGALGGAVSVDQEWRTRGKSWWSEEATTRTDVEALGHGKLDVLLTHEAPAGVTGLVSGLIDPLPEHIAWDAWQNRLRIAEAVANTSPALVFSGHWHQRLTQQLNPETAVHVLAHDNHVGNAVSLDLATLTVTDFPIKPL